MAEKPAARKSSKPEKIGVTVTIQYTGHIKKADLMLLHGALGSSLHNHLENGGNGHEVGAAKQDDRDNG